MLAQNSVLLSQILDHLLLVLIHPTGNRHQQELKWIEHSRHLLPILSTRSPVTNRLSIHSVRISGPCATVIGRFYNSRDHSTVCRSIQRIEALRESDPEVDALITELKQQLFVEGEFPGRVSEQRPANVCLSGPGTISVDEMAEIVAARVCAYLETLMRHRSWRTWIVQRSKISRQIHRSSDEEDIQTRA